MLSDIEIAQGCQMRPITEVAAAAGLDADDLELYGKYKAKAVRRRVDQGEGQAERQAGPRYRHQPDAGRRGQDHDHRRSGSGTVQSRARNAMIALREPSLGPVFGIKGGAAGGGYAQVVPMEDINLHFTGDMHAITAANNLLCRHAGQPHAAGQSAEH